MRLMDPELIGSAPDYIDVFSGKVQEPVQLFRHF